ncbi:MAG: hypothetical protein NBV67_00740 [Tagaea sp.]|nr:hypothetical protein [Tagaea sp.]
MAELASQNMPEFPKLTMTSGGTVYGGWKSATIRTSIENLAGGFQIEASQRWPGGASRLMPGDRVTVAIGGEAVIAGHIDAIDVKYDAKTHDVTIAGRDRTGDLVDCSAANEPGEWQGVKLGTIARALCRPFGVDVTIDGDEGPAFDFFRLTEGETAGAALERLCRHRGLLRVADAKGGLLLTRAGTARAPAAIKLGVNVLAASLRLDDSQRHSVYTVKGQAPQADLQAASQTVSPVARVTDKGVSRHRPLIVIAEEPGDEAQYAVRATWEANMRFGKARRGSYTLAGWTANGKLWRPNALVRIDDEFAGLAEGLLIVGVDYTLDERGSRTALHVARAAAFDLRPMPDPKRQVTL